MSDLHRAWRHYLATGELPADTRLRRQVMELIRAIEATDEATHAES